MVNNIRYEVLKKTLVYRLIAIGIGFAIPYLLTGDIIIMLKVGFFTELSTLISYYLFELVWRSFMKKRNLKSD